MNNETITPNAWQQQMEAVEGLRAQMDATPLGTENEDEIVDRYADARDSLMQTPAPDLVAVQWKVTRLKEQADDGLLVKADADAVRADIARLAMN